MPQATELYRIEEENKGKPGTPLCIRGNGVVLWIEQYSPLQRPMLEQLVAHANAGAKQEADNAR